RPAADAPTGAEAMGRARGPAANRNGKLNKELAMTTQTTSKNAQYAVIGAGYGHESIGNFHGVHIAYRGNSLAQARRALAREQASVRRLRKTAGNQNASDTYCIVATSDDYHGWVPLDRFEA